MPPRLRFLISGRMMIPYTIIARGYPCVTPCRGETASGRSREAHARQIARATKPQAQEALAIKKARSKIKSKKTFESIYD